MKLEVGMYVRYNGQIMKITELGYNNETFMSNGNGWFSLYTCDASHNIIDLIEVGDFITLGEKNYPLQVRNIWEFAGDINVELSNGARFENLHEIDNFKIYSIVTKEQFESMAYKVV